jgi:PAS domain S-box-containing protein
MNNSGSIVAHYIISPLFLLLLIGGFLGIITFLFLLRFRKTDGVKYWLVWQVACVIWAFTYALEYSATTLETKILWSKFSYFGIVYGPVSFLLFSLAFSSKFNYLRKKYVILLYVFASLFIIFPFTNDFHHLHWRSYSINPATNATDYVYGPLFWIMTFFAYVALFMGIINIFMLYFRLSEFYKHQVTLLFISSLLPLVGNIIYVFHINPLPGFDWTPFSFLITGILIAVNIAHFKMFDLVPFARNKLINLIPDAILILDNSMRIADYNPAFKELVRAEHKDFLGMKINELWPHREQFIHEIILHDKYQFVASQEYNGQIRHFDSQSVTLFDQKKLPIGRLIMMKDITLRVNAEEKIKETNNRLVNEIHEKEKLIGDLDAFSHTVAHDLKSMLSAIVTASGLIKWSIDGISKPEILEINDLISQSATKTMYITSELLTLASVRQQEIKLVPVNMQKLVDESIARVADMIRERNAELHFPEDWPEVLGYEAWLEEVWVNYISNAVKYGGTPPIIHIGYDILPECKAKFWIRDNGKGLSEEEITMLFSKFTRLDTIRAEGHGLGLSIVKRIIEKLNGEVGIESRNIPGEGSSFYFILSLIEA